MNRDQSSQPRLVTKDNVCARLEKVGVRSGMHLMVHSSLKGLGYLVNGAYDVIDALSDAVGSAGTILVPAQSGQVTDPASWKSPPVPSEWIETIRAQLMPFDAYRTLIRNRGMLPEHFLRYTDVKRSRHPIASIAARGARAENLTATHPLHEPYGPESPCHRLYETGGYCLLMNVPMSAFMALHIAEFIANCPHIYQHDVRVLVEDKEGRRFERLRKYPGTSAHFEKLRESLIARNALREDVEDGYRLTLIDIRLAVDYTVMKLSENPTYLIHA